MNSGDGRWILCRFTNLFIHSFQCLVDPPQLHRILIRFNCVLFIDFLSPLWLANICTWLTSSLRNFIKNDEEKFIYVLFSFLCLFPFSKTITLAKLFSHGRNQKWNQTEDPSLALTFTNNILNIWMKRNGTNNSCDVTSLEWKRKNIIKYWKVWQKESLVVKGGMCRQCRSLIRNEGTNNGRIRTKTMPFLGQRSYYYSVFVSFLKTPRGKMFVLLVSITSCRPYEKKDLSQHFIF